MLLPLLFIILPMVASWMIFTKAGRHGWSALVPFHRNIRQLEIAGKPGWWIFLYLVPILNIVIYVKTLLGLSRNFGHGGWFAVGLLFCPIVFFPILAFGKSQYAPIASSNQTH